MGDLEIRGFVIRGFPFTQKSANCKDSLYLVKFVTFENNHTLFLLHAEYQLLSYIPDQNGIRYGIYNILKIKAIELFTLSIYKIWSASQKETESCDQS